MKATTWNGSARFGKALKEVQNTNALCALDPCGCPRNPWYQICTDFFDCLYPRYASFLSQARISLLVTAFKIWTTGVLFALQNEDKSFLEHVFRVILDLLLLCEHKRTSTQRLIQHDTPIHICMSRLLGNTHKYTHKDMHKHTQRCGAVGSRLLLKAAQGWWSSSLWDMMHIRTRLESSVRPFLSLSVCLRKIPLI